MGTGGGGGRWRGGRGREREGGVSTCSTVKDTGRPVVQCAEETEATMCRRLYNLCNIKVYCKPYKESAPFIVVRCVTLVRYGSDW